MAGDSSVRSVARTLDLLNLFDHHRPFLTLREIVERSGLPKTTVVRLLANLQSRALLSVRADNTYTLGAGMLRWVRMAGALWEVNEQTVASMRRLVDACGETVNIYVRQDATRMSIAQQQGVHTVRNVVEVGTPMPLWAGSAAKVLLTGAPQMLDDLTILNPSLDVARLRAEVDEARRVGFAVSHGEREDGASAVAAPIVAADGRVLAALCISGPTSRLTGERLETAVGAAVDAAKEISGFGLGGVEELL
ncbi:IclR family transcriptional regulator [Mycobacterium neglectum]|uniref:IclR family transcriptional regulator n=1 Tax=Mycobacterium neglectum TaxID=242737 RepID=UPI000BFF0D4C|nr:IclR family transcriptional regulator [Mycobacterium neglectum]